MSQSALSAVPIGMLAAGKGAAAAHDENARDVIVRILQSTGQPLSWQLLCQPGVDECVFYHTVNLPGAGTVRVSEASRTSYKARAARRRPSLHLNSPPPRLAVSQRQ